MLISELKPGQKFTDGDGDACLHTGEIEDNRWCGWYCEPEALEWSSRRGYWRNEQDVDLGWPGLPDLPPEAQALVDAFEKGEGT